MANGDVFFPKIANGNWWKLRNLFKKKVPAVLTQTYLATALSMGEASAQNNLINPFKKIGIIDEDGKPTDLAYDWRDDNKYAEVCSTLIDNCYPQELKDLFHEPDADFKQLTSWFMNSARCGESAAKYFARFYMLLLKADLSEAEVVTVKKTFSQKTAKVAVKKKAVKAKPKAEHEGQTPPAPKNPPATVFGNAPELHINIQLHISPESSTEQIDKIFESMAKHLKDFNK